MKTRRTRKRSTRKKGGAWSLFGPPKEDKFADEIIADTSNATAIIRSPTTNLERLRAKIVEKDTEKKLDSILRYIDDERRMRRYDADQNSWT
jgi:hypothetical protein